MSHQPIRPLSLLAAILACASGSFPTEAFAHAHLKSATPPAGGVVAKAPSELDLTFSEGLNLKFTGVEIREPDKTAVATGAATLGAGGDTTLIVPVTGTLAPGAYSISWHALSTDGHKTKGSYTFTIKP